MFKSSHKRETLHRPGSIISRPPTQVGNLPCAESRGVHVSGSFLGLPRGLGSRLWPVMASTPRRRSENRPAAGSDRAPGGCRRRPPGPMPHETIAATPPGGACRCVPAKVGADAVTETNSAAPGRCGDSGSNASAPDRRPSRHLPGFVQSRTGSRVDRFRPESGRTRNGGPTGARWDDGSCLCAAHYAVRER